MRNLTYSNNTCINDYKTRRIVKYGGQVVRLYSTFLNWKGW